MEFLGNKPPQVESGNIDALIITGMSTNKEELAKVSGYGDKAANNEAAHNFSLFALHMYHVHYKNM